MKNISLVETENRWWAVGADKHVIQNKHSPKLGRWRTIFHFTLFTLSGQVTLMLPLVCIQTINREPCDASQLQRVLFIIDVFGLEWMGLSHFPGFFSRTIYWASYLKTALLGCRQGSCQPLERALVCVLRFPLSNSLFIYLDKFCVAFLNQRLLPM